MARPYLRLLRGADLATIKVSATPACDLGARARAKADEPSMDAQSQELHASLFSFEMAVSDSTFYEAVSDSSRWG